MVKIYTKKGDLGKTSLLSGQRVYKDAHEVEVYGQVDELNSYIGLLLAMLNKSSEKIDLNRKTLARVQVNLFNIGSRLACAPEKWSNFKLPDIESDIIENIEAVIDEMQNQLPELKNFVLPGGCQEAATAHICRVKTRKVERKLVSLRNHWSNQGDEVESCLKNYFIFFNRLSDYFFVLARFINLQFKVEEVIWKG